ncbi:ninja-family protein AFP3 [Elaeis guineensis]|uniref:Ninja-family protein n=1 Tax=Elaeis guineensis var. tenera TaxID=51953 RepID=A0A6I9RB47_ELAGV|nr:ninja-family protein AFP3 [Elaeis guineensis]
MASEAMEGEIEELSGRIQGCPRDFLRRFGGNSCHEEPPVVVAAAGEEVEEIELSLGLSLGGRFGVEPKEQRRLVRSSSIATLSMFPSENDFPVAAPPTRACSLPMEAEEEHRNRKEMQSLKRLEVKRKRSEKRNLSKLAARDQREENFNEGTNGGHGRVLPRSASTGTGARQVDASRCFRPASQWSIGSQGSSSSGMSNFESQMLQGSNGGAREEVEESWKKIGGRASWVREEMEEMPRVSTRGDGPNGRRIEGLLYRYGKGKEVRIVCVCHGSFLTPAEFVRHAGGGNVAHPLRHIVVYPTPSASL